MMKIGLHTRPSRRVRKVVPVTAALAAAMLVLSGCAAGGTASDAKSLSIVVEGGGKSQLSDIAKLYTKDTGIKVNFVELPYAGLYDRITSDLNSGKPSFDLAAVDAVWLKDFSKGLVPLDDLFTSKVKADLFPALDTEANVDGHFVGMPAWTNAEMLFYRTDLFNDPTQKANFKKKYGYDLVVPTTWQQYTDVAQFFTQDTNHDGKIDLYGTPVVGATDAEWEAAVAQSGSPDIVLKKDGTPDINNVQTKAALDWYSGLTKYAPPGADQVDFAAEYNLFVQGKVAMTRYWASAYRIPKGSAIDGKFAAAPMIAGPAGIGAIPGAWYLTIPKGGHKTAAAKKFIQFAYDHNDVAVQKSGFGVGSRISAFKKYENTPGYEYIKPLLATLSGPATAPRPASTKWQQIVDSVIIPMLQKSVQPGADNQALLDAAQAKIETIVK